MSEKVFAPRLARRTFLAASAASAALMLTGCLNLAPRYEKPAAPTETSQDWAVSPRDAWVKEGELVTWDKFFLDERLRKVIELALANNRDLRQSMLEVERLRALYRVSRAELFPTVGAQADATHSRSSIDALQPGSGAHDVAVVKGQHHRVAALGIEQVGEPILGSPVPVAQALGEEALLRGRHVQMVVVGGLVSDCVWHSAYSLLNAGVWQGVFHRRSISSSHLAMFI